METAEYKNYTITRFESGTIRVTKNGLILSPTKPILRELAKELNVSIENANGNLHITRQLGVLVMRAIKQKQSKENPQQQVDEMVDMSKAAVKKVINTDKPFPPMLKKQITHYLNNNKHGNFYLNRGEKIEQVLTDNQVPNQYGVYIIYSVKSNQESLIYIGKSGTMTTSGEFKSQGIKNRLKAVATNDMPRGKYFQQIIQKQGFDKLKFIWIVTFDDTVKELPAYSEAKLLQLYFDYYGELPALNKSI
jgi:hypothetical protein